MVARGATSGESVVRADDGMGIVCSVDRRATDAGVVALRAGGSAADAAIAANAVLAVTSPHLCGMGGDLWAIVHEAGREPRVLNASGRAGSGVDADALRARGLTHVPRRGEMAAVPVPGCVDGWVALSERDGKLPLDEVLAPAIALADDGFAASGLLALSAVLVDHLGIDGIGAGLRAGDTVRRPGVAAALRAIARDGRDGFYAGTFGRGLLGLAEGTFTASDLERPQADWMEPAMLEVFGSRVWTAPPSSQGYLLLAVLHVAEALGLPSDERAPEWLRILAGAAIVTGVERSPRLHEHANARDLLDPAHLARWAEATRRWPESTAAQVTTPGDTTFVCSRDRDGRAVALIQSNAMDYGAHLVEPATGTFLQNRGIGFSLEPGHPGELGPGRRPPSTLCPVVVTDDRFELTAVTGTMGGDSQPQLLAQGLTRLLHRGVDPVALLDEPRFVLKRDGDPGFDLWSSDASSAGCHLVTDRAGLARWEATAERLRLAPTREPWASPSFGHAHLITRVIDGWIGVAEPRAEGSAATEVR